MPIDFNEAMPIAGLGLLVNVASVLLLGGGHHGHAHSATITATPTPAMNLITIRPMRYRPTTAP